MPTSFIARVNASPAYAWVRIILAEVRSEILDRVRRFAVDRAARCAQLLFYYLSTDFFLVSRQLSVTL
jgi:hypothetical protein